MITVVQISLFDAPSAEHVETRSLTLSEPKRFWEAFNNSGTVGAAEKTWSCRGGNAGGFRITGTVGAAEKS